MAVEATPEAQAVPTTTAVAISKLAFPAIPKRMFATTPGNDLPATPGDNETQRLLYSIALWHFLEGLLSGDPTINMGRL